MLVCVLFLINIVSSDVVHTYSIAAVNKEEVYGIKLGFGIADNHYCFVQERCKRWRVCGRDH